MSGRVDGIRVVFLDIDDTLLSFRGYTRVTITEGFRHFGLPAVTDDTLATFYRENDALWERIERGDLTFEGLQEVRWNRVFRALGIAFDGPTFERYFRDALFTSAIPEPGAQEVVAYLAGRYTLCAASNGPFEQQQNRLRLAGMLPHFSQLFVSSAIGASKPSRDYFEACFAALRQTMPDLQPHETIMVGNSMSADIAGGRAYGMQTCLYTMGAPVTAVPDGADYAVRDLTDLKELL